MKDQHQVTECRAEFSDPNKVLIQSGSTRPPCSSTTAMSDAGRSMKNRSNTPKKSVHREDAGNENARDMRSNRHLTGRSEREDSAASPAVPDPFPANRLEAAMLYRNRFGWAVHPLRGHRDKNVPLKARGKAPINRGWNTLKPSDVTEAALKAHFGNGADFNVGIVVQSPHVVVDLDSKADRGASVESWLQSHPELAAVPRERTGGGVHLHFRCHDVPKITKGGQAYDGKLETTVAPGVTAELFRAGMNLVVTPSVHSSGHQYRWEVTGPIPVLSWERLRSIFGFTLPDEERPKAGGRRESTKWWHRFKGDLRSLDIVKLFQKLGLYGQLGDADRGTHNVHCPWEQEHSGMTNQREAGSDTVVFANTDRENFPGFKCFHAHCESRSLEEVLEFAETKSPGLVDQCCERQRVWTPGSRSEGGLPRIILPSPGRQYSEFAHEVGAILKPTLQWFTRDDCVVVLREKPVESVRASKGLQFHTITDRELCTEIEEFVQTGQIRRDSARNCEFVPTTMTREQAAILLASPQFRKQLPRIDRILDVQIPILHGGKVVLPERGYDARFRTFCDPAAPPVAPGDTRQTKSLFQEILGGFCWADEQSCVHAIAYLLTPFCRGLMGWDARFPLFLFESNRPRAGKDYLAGVGDIIHCGYDIADAPLGRDDEETRKRITSFALAGRRRVHFGNCKGKLDSRYFEQAITSRTWGDRILGSNTDRELTNELMFSISANTGLEYSEDLAGRMRKIRLTYAEEDPNSRRFPKNKLWDWIAENRSKILSCFCGLVIDWVTEGMPAGPTPFTSFPEFARVVGGIMHAAGLGDPCLPDNSDDSGNGDRRTTAMKVLFQMCLQEHGENWIPRETIRTTIENRQPDDDALDFFGDLGEESSDRGARTRFGNTLRAFSGRELGGILLERQCEGAQRSENLRFRFIRSTGSNLNQGPQILANLLGGRTSVSDESATATPDTPVPASAPLQQDKLPENDPPPAEEAPAPDAPSDAYSPDAVLISTEAQLGPLLATVKSSDKPLALDIETYGADTLDPWNGDIRLLSVSDGQDFLFLIDLKQLKECGADLSALWNVIRTREVIIHNARFDALWLRVKYEIELPRVFCTLTASKLLTNGTKEANDLGSCLQRHLNLALPKDQGKSDWGANELNQKQLKYAADDVAHLHRLKEKLQTELNAVGLEETAKLEMGLLPVVTSMEAAGTALDRDRLETMKTEAAGQLERARSVVKEQLGAELNPDSVPQLQEAFATLGVKVPNTKEETLQGIDHMAARAVLEYRKAKKQLQTIENLEKAVASDGRIHSSFNPLGAETGRFSSSDPNLQNVPRGGLRDSFVPAEGKSLVVADYSQIELRVAAAVAGETKMIEAYKKGIDLHRQTAATVLQKPVSEITDEDRRVAKAVNFGLLYGQGAEGLVRYAKSSYGVDLTKRQASSIRARFFRAYPAIARWHADADQKAGRGIEEVRTVTGRRRMLPKGWKEEWHRFTGLVNTVVQGGAADGLKAAMVSLSAALPSHARIVCTVHDELLVECDQNAAPEVKQLVEKHMIDAMSKLFPQVPIEVEAKVCKNWGEK